MVDFAKYNETSCPKVASDHLHASMSEACLQYNYHSRCCLLMTWSASRNVGVVQKLLILCAIGVRSVKYGNA